MKIKIVAALIAFGCLALVAGCQTDGEDSSQTATYPTYNHWWR